ncbi:ScyD/ScyE family protein [Georgenia sp. H159]|uniref:ScyD/ScyE family protein n=1 Tax=Georgenia sp. H159 TaxID=3076115 RepID=UPI002D785FF6|nr:ScyD/ScyE family protein [Georgenia sp. H159]
MRKSVLTAGAGILALTATLVSVPAQAGGHDREPQVIASGLVGPLSLDVGHGGDVLVSQSFAGLLSKVDKRGRVTNLHQLEAEAGEIVGVDNELGYTYHIENVFSGEVPTSHIVKTSKKGHRTVVSDDFWAYEMEHNPDAGMTYGFRDLSQSCADEVATLEEAAGLPLNEYTGIVESHAYQLEVQDGNIYVADAAMNAVLKVDEQTGEISTVAVLPATTITFTAELEAALESMLPPGADVPDCVVGASYTPEPVPTDVKVDRHGKLYVSTLQGAAGEILPLSKIYHVDPETGRSTEVAGGMHGATGLDLAPTGSFLVVAEMFAGEVSMVRLRNWTGSAETIFTADSPADVDVSGRTVFATTGTFGDGALVKYRLP